MQLKQNLKLLFEGKKGVEFIDPKSLVKNFIEIPIDKDKTFNVVLTHGNQIKCEEKSYATIANQFLLNNKRVDLILCGHYHHVVNFEKLSFAGSMIGQTEYSCGLGFTTRASQSIYIINKDSLQPFFLYFLSGKHHAGNCKNFYFMRSLTQRFGTGAVLIHIDIPISFR